MVEQVYQEGVGGLLVKWSQFSTSCYPYSLQFHPIAPPIQKLVCLLIPGIWVDLTCSDHQDMTAVMWCCSQAQAHTSYTPALLEGCLPLGELA